MYHLIGPKEKPKTTPFDLKDKDKHTWIHDVAKMNTRAYHGDLASKQIDDLYSTGKMKQEFAQRMVLDALKAYFDAQALRHDAKSNINCNPSAKLQHPKYKHACKV